MHHLQFCMPNNLIFCANPSITSGWLLNQFTHIEPTTSGWLLNQFTHINPSLNPINLVLCRSYVLPLPNLHPFLHLKELEGLPLRLFSSRAASDSQMS